MKKLSGIVVPVVTPLTEDDQVDAESLENLVEHCIKGGLQAIYPCGTTGEMMYLTVEERKLVAETVISMRQLYRKATGPAVAKSRKVLARE